MYRNGKLDSFWGSTLPKIRILWRKASNKSCSKLNFASKSPSPRSAYYVYLLHELGGTKDLPFLKCNANGKSLKALAPLLGEIDIWARGLFCTKFDSKQLLFEAFFHKMRIFGSIEPQSESNFPFLKIIRFQTYWSLEPSISPCGGSRHMRLRTFLYKIQFRTTFIWSFFWRTAYFWQRWAPKLTYFPIIIHFNI